MDTRRRYIKPAIGAASLILILAVLTVAWLTQLERLFVFFPTAELDYTPDQAGITYEDVYFTNESGAKLHGWYVPGTGEITWLWFHGNGGNIGHRIEEMASIHHLLGVNLLIFDYQGYGRSEGRPSEKGTYKDARAALKYLHGRPDVDPKRIVYFGRSLGAAVAVELATDHAPQGMVLVAPFASLGDMARIIYRPLPLHWLVGNRYNSLDRIKHVNRPLLMFHGDQDSTIPISQGIKLFGAAREPKQFHRLKGTGHNDTASSGREDYWNTLVKFNNSLSNGHFDK